MQSNYCCLRNAVYFTEVLQKAPNAVAWVKGGTDFPNLSGWLRFYQTRYGVLVSAEITGLPIPAEKCRKGIYAFHIHKETHYNPQQCEHPNHAGDLPPLFATEDGYAYMTVLTDRFTAKEIIGLTAVIHERPDDFTTQPSGNAGNPIARGKILPGKTIR